jgi:hypothetical protein
MYDAPTLIAPSYRGLLAVLAHERRLLEQLLFRHAALALVVAAGEHRFVGRALDEASDVESELAMAEVVRAATLDELLPGAEPSLEEVIAAAPADLERPLRLVAADLARLLADVEDYRSEARTAVQRRSEQTARALAGIGATGYRADGSPVPPR